jgi:hypothetical protein
MSSKKEVTICEEKNVYNDVFSYPSEIAHNLRKHNKLTREDKEKVDKAWRKIYDEEKEDFINKKAKEFGIDYLESAFIIYREDGILEREQDMEENIKRRMTVIKPFKGKEIQQIIDTWIKIYSDKHVIDSDNVMPMFDSDDDTPMLDDDDDVVFVDASNVKEYNKFLEFYNK